MSTVLIIDDDAQNLRLLQMMLNRFEHDVHIVQRGDEGVEIAQQINPDVILLDLLMPKTTYDGVQVVNILRSLPHFQQTPIIAISAADAHTIQEQLDSKLFTDFLQKPITLNKLEALFDKLKQYNIS